MSDFQPLLTRAERAEKERDVLAANVAALADEWEAESSRYEGYGKGRSASHRQCRQIAHTLAESATDLRALLGGDTTALDARLAEHGERIAVAIEEDRNRSSIRPTQEYAVYDQCARIARQESPDANR
jgi:hypothetical protein